jgi:DNA phosphorothioation-dependent restriction protein DptG
LPIPQEKIKVLLWRSFNWLLVVNEGDVSSNEQYLLTGRDFIVDIDQYNTCDPNTGNWTERILPLKKYQEILNRQKYQVRIKNGFYNSDRKNIFLSLIAKGINFFVRNSGRIGRVLAPYIILMVWGDSKFNK